MQLFVGILGLIIAITLFVWNLNRYTYWRPVQGKIDSHGYVDTDEGRLATTIVRYVISGHSQIFDDAFLRLLLRRPGSEVPLLVHPQRDEKAVVNIWYCRHALELIVGAACLGHVLIAVFA